MTTLSHKMSKIIDISRKIAALKILLDNLSVRLSVCPFRTGF